MPSSSARRKSIRAFIASPSIARSKCSSGYGLLDELDLLHIHGHRHYYESHGPRDHIHVACLRCGKVREVESDLFEQLKRQIEHDTGIKITVTRTEIGGYCESCR